MRLPMFFRRLFVFMNTIPLPIKASGTMIANTTTHITVVESELPTGDSFGGFGQTFS